MMRLTPKQLPWLKALLHLACALPLCWLIILVMTDNAGGDPVQFIIHYTGKGTLNALAATLCVSPLARRLKWPLLIQCRRLLGLWCFAFGVLHLLAFLSLDLLFAWSLLLSEVVKRPYLVVGASGLLILTALALTSFKAAQRKMGRRWQQLHNWVYLAAMLGPVHYFWSVKSEIIEPSIYLGAFILLLYLRRDRLMRWLSITA
ncbi:protein-methionine-sulfoxide reductase heme-binding subunit MsrQ [Shewanella sedimentimangrovi]|uniref:Protein-methionine-sulfoxide reductase heme-binding subunit MsrQ n=1 Tax=Shewanella sedimentimangrovi TaxID=2814293 RepID=A0ABX7R7I8_9GAMM|nr:protein-methionine-sulfoxide reductase heme-binding subunit MsrQ [Shewanella sedimentimangrovi]QSX39045.1 protein-methionine-sulfoxide reductase heme-binding subunit MsrQ [Shewanella sedimentimangrovi]